MSAAYATDEQRVDKSYRRTWIDARYIQVCRGCGAPDPRLCQCPESSECPYCGVEGSCQHAIKGEL